MANTQMMQAQAPHPAVFRELTRPNSVPCGSLAVSAFGATPSVINLPHSGWLAKIYLFVTGTLTTGAGTPAGTWATYPPMPFSLFRRIRVVTNTQTEIANLTGWGLYNFNRWYRRTNFWDVDLKTDNNSTNRAALLAAPAAGTPAASTAYNVAACLEIPVATDDALFLGALFLQSDTVSMGVEITPPTAADIHAVTGVSVTPALTYSAQAIFFEQPADLSVRPNTQYVHMLREENRPLTGTGLQTFYLPSGNTFLKIGGVFENNSAQITNANILNLGMGYAQTVNPYNESYDLHLLRNKSYLGNTLPDGRFLFDMSVGSGIPGLYEGRDFLNSSRTTDLQFNATINSGLSLSGGNIRLITEQLQAIGG